jgi:hypothetical protein
MRRAFDFLFHTVFLTIALSTPASAEFGFEEAQVDFFDKNGDQVRDAGSHPYEAKIRLEMNSVPFGGGLELPEGAAKDLRIELPAGFAGNPFAVERCQAADFFAIDDVDSGCPDETVLGVQAVKADFAPLPEGDDTYLHIPFFNLIPPPGVAARLGFVVLGIPLVVDASVDPVSHNVVSRVTKIAQATHFYGSVTTLWGDPHSPAHDPIRGSCLENELPAPADKPPTDPIKEACPLEGGESESFLTLPTSCTGPLETLFSAVAWPIWVPDPEGNLQPQPSKEDSITAFTEPGLVACSKLGLESTVSAQPTTDRAESPSGLAFDLQIDDEGLTSTKEGALAFANLKKAVVTLPEGVTVNPSQAEGLAVCSEAGLARETASSEFGEGCPPASKIGAIEVETPLLEGQILRGSMFVATPFDDHNHNDLADDSLIAVYVVIKSPERGVVVKQALKVEPDPETGQLITTTDEIPQLPFSDFRLRFREGGRSPLITPAACGSYETEAVFTTWADPDNPLPPETSSFQITRGVGGGDCPPAGPPPFAPGFGAGTLNNNAGSYSPFAMRLTRRDGDQDLTRFDATLPPGVVAKLAGVSKCPDAQIAQIETKTGRQELASPSCPANSRIGSVWGGAGVGSQLTYVPGSIYLAGPFGKAPLSVVGVVPAVAGPFDVGVVTTRQALTLDPVTGQPQVDGALSEPIPHILAGIPLKVRDIQVNVDRPQFTLNPTSCKEMAVTARIWGGGLDPFSLLDNSPVPVSDRFQAANCSLLGFKPRLSFNLKGGVERGDNPAFKAVLRARPGDANLRKTTVRFPRSTFLDQGHIRTICTRVQFAADNCPKGAIYGSVKAFTPLLEEPLEGPVYLRSSNNLLPDIVFDLKGVVDIEAAARADSVKGKLRVTFPAIPDAPVSRVIVEMQGGSKGLLENSRNICSPVPRAVANLEAQNAKRLTLRPPMRARGCG